MIRWRSRSDPVFEWEGADAGVEPFWVGFYGTHPDTDYRRY